MTWPLALVLTLVACCTAALDAAPSPPVVAVGLERQQVISLAGEWHFREDPEEAGEQGGWFQPGRVRGRVGKVPMPWQLAFEEMRKYSGTAWYEKTITVPREHAGKRIALASYGVSDIAKVWVNGTYAGEHRGTQTPFLIDITGLVSVGKPNTITIRASDPAMGASVFLDSHSLIRVSGLWQDIWLEVTDKTFIADLFMIPDVDRSRAEARLTVISAEPVKRPRPLSVKLYVRGPDGGEFDVSGPLTIESPEAPARLVIPFELKNAQLWELDNPRLYKVRAVLLEGQKQLDQVTADFGMRKIEARGTRIYLNNKPVYLVGGGLDPGPYGGAVDVNWHQPPPYHQPTDDEIRKDIGTIKSFGVNFVRVPLRPASPRFLYWADRMGLLVWQGGPWTPTEGIAGQEGFEQYKVWWHEIVLRDRNHPSLVLWELFNESFGMSWESLKKITAELYDSVKELDPTRFVLDNSGGKSLNELNYIGNHGKTDLHDVHAYPGFPALERGGGEIRYPPDTREWAEGIRFQGKPVLVTEFAPAPYVYDVTKIKELWGGKDPWWFTERPVLAYKLPDPAKYASMWDHVGFEARYRRWGLEKVYGDFTRFTELSDWYYFHGLKYMTELIRMNPDITGFVAWLFDSAPHSVGSVDYFKEKKAYWQEIARLWTQDLVLIDNKRKNFWPGEALRADVHVSHFGNNEPLEGTVEWWLEDTDVQGDIRNINVAPGGGVARVGEIMFRMPDAAVTRALRLYAELKDNAGNSISKNYTDVWLYPLAYRQPKVPTITLYKTNPASFEVLGYEIVAAGARKPGTPRVAQGFDPSAPVIVTTTLDEPVLKAVREGRTAVLLLADEANYWMGQPNPKVLSVESTLARFGLKLGSKFLGGHSDSFFIKKIPGLFDRIPFENPMQWQFYKVWPKRVLLGLKPEGQDDMLAGGYGNLIRSVPQDSAGERHWLEVTTTLAQFRYGAGRLIVSTFDLLKPALDDPVAAIMLHDLIEYAISGFQPRTELRDEGQVTARQQ